MPRTASSSPNLISVHTVWRAIDVTSNLYHREEDSAFDTKNYQPYEHQHDGRMHCNHCDKVYQHCWANWNGTWTFVCGSHSNYMASLIAHVYKHRNPKPLRGVKFKCNLCNKIMLDTARTGHMLWLANLRPFQCDKCDKSNGASTKDS